MNSPAAAFHPSNLLTGLSLTAGLGSVAGALHGSASAAGALLAMAALCDTFDGWFARRFVRSDDRQALGAQLDSLSDAVAFGVAPVVATSILIGAPGGNLSAVWWLAAAGYTACALARLAFYNVAGGKGGFVGVPAPAAALAWSTALAFNPAVTSATVLALALALAMIAPLAIPRPGRTGLSVFAAWPVLLLVVHLR
jgi:CDP-diacylglycerol---serine O-phosphatidyltransferase